MGNLIGDYVKGRLEHVDLDEAIVNGLELHRKIDELADQHPACIRAKNIFRIHYKLYSGPIVDVLWDYYLANDPAVFSNEAELRIFSQKIYQSISSNKEIIPAQASELFNHLVDEDWLYDIRTLKGLKAAYNRLMFRFNNQMTSDIAFELTMRHYYELNQMYLEFIDDIKDNLKFN